MLKAIRRLVVLPRSFSDFEDYYLTRMNRLGFALLACHMPIFVILAYFNDTEPLTAVVLCSAILAGPWIALKTLQSKRTISVVIGVSTMFMGGLLCAPRRARVQGSLQIEDRTSTFSLRWRCCACTQIPA